MKRLSLFRSGLQAQIILPMLVSAVIAGIAAAVLAVYLLSALTGRWVDDVARTTTDDYAYRCAEYARQLQHEAGISVSGVREVLDAKPGDIKALRDVVARTSVALDSDTVLLLDSDSRVVAASSAANIAYGSRPMGDVVAWSGGTPKAAFTRIGDRFVLAAVHPVSRNAGYTLLVAHPVDGAFLRRLGVGPGFGVGLCDVDMKPVAHVMGGVTSPHAVSVLRVLRGHDDGIRAIMMRASDDGAGSGSLAVDGAKYRVRIRRLSLGEGPTALTTAYMTGIVSEDITSAAARTTRNLVLMWSVVAVAVLALMGGYIARRVTDPLLQLSAGARRIADGDFSTKVHVGGSNEITALAESFNTMTDSLRERSETLTKKVLELATLYEMSRALGSTLDMDELLGSVLDSALRIFDLDLGYVVLRDKESGSLSIRAIRSATSHEALDEAVRTSMSEWVVREGRPLIFNPDTNSGGGQIDIVTGAKAALCVPLVSPEGTIGSITIGSTESSYRFNSDDVRLLSTIANHVTIAVGNIELFSSLQDAYLATVRSLAAAVDAKDSYTRGHSDHVARYATLIAEWMGLSHDQRVALEMAAYLHDIGKIGVPEDILLKPGTLTDEEMEQMRHHPLIGANILRPVAFPWAINPVVRHHHEAWDGTGYPAGLRGDEIPLLARILTVADSFEAMTADRPYRAGMSVDQALEELASCSGTQFDPRIVEVFSAIVTELEQAGEILSPRAAEEASSDEVRAIFAALVDGVFASFRKLGGPRLASNVEVETDAYFLEADLPFRVRNGHLSYSREAPAEPDAEIEDMRMALRRMDAIIGRVSGGTLVDHFYDDALVGVSERMGALARELGFFG